MRVMCVLQTLGKLRKAETKQRYMAAIGLVVLDKIA